MLISQNKRWKTRSTFPPLQGVNLLIVWKLNHGLINRKARWRKWWNIMQIAKTTLAMVQSVLKSPEIGNLEYWFKNLIVFFWIMFGCLFETEEHASEHQTSAADATGMWKQQKLDSPREPRGQTRICGLQNQGATCYLNSLLQTLFFTPEFRGDDLFQFYPKPPPIEEHWILPPQLNFLPPPTPS